MLGSRRNTCGFAIQKMTYRYHEMEDSWNRDTPQIIHFYRIFPNKNQPFWGTPKLGNPRIEIQRGQSMLFQWLSGVAPCQVLSSQSEVPVVWLCLSWMIPMHTPFFNKHNIQTGPRDIGWGIKPTDDTSTRATLGTGATKNLCNIYLGVPFKSHLFVRLQSHWTE